MSPKSRNDARAVVHGATLQQDRSGKLSVAQREAARVAVARGRSLREVAADFGVSHETVRRAIGEAEAAVA